RKVLDPGLDGTGDDVEQHLLAGLVSLDAAQAAAVRPAPVAVHDDRDVLGHRRELRWMHTGPVQWTERYGILVRVRLRAQRVPSHCGPVTCSRERMPRSRCHC